MRSRGYLLLTFTLLGTLGWGVNSAPQSQAPQTARQALLEMFFSKSSGTFAKHLPAAMLAALAESGAMANLNQFALMGGQLEHQQKNLQTFETGSVLLTAENPTTASKIEVIVDNDTLRGDQDDIELSFQAYKNGAAERTPFMPQMTFSMKEELGIWKLNEVSVTIHVPLADPDLLKTMVTAMKVQAARSAAATGVETTSQGAGNDAAVVAAMRTIVTAETTYATTYRPIGYTCTLTDLDGFGGSERNEHQAMLINAGLAGGKRYGYVFTLSQCTGTPASSFYLTATPSNSIGRRAYCADPTGIVRYSPDGSAASCLKSGTPVQ